MSYEYEKYISMPDKVGETIDHYGVAIVRNVLDESEITNMNTGMWDYLEHVTQKFAIPMDRNEKDTWIEYLKLYPKHSMLLQQYGIGHAQYIWDIRQNPKVVNIFSELLYCILTIQ